MSGAEPPLVPDGPVLFHLRGDGGDISLPRSAVRQWTEHAGPGAILIENASLPCVFACQDGLLFFLLWDLPGMDRQQAVGFTVMVDRAQFDAGLKDFWLASGPLKKTMAVIGEELAAMRSGNIA